jgi:hypothetical protein
MGRRSSPRRLLSLEFKVSFMVPVKETPPLKKERGKEMEYKDRNNNLT